MGNDCDDYRFYRGLNGVFDPILINIERDLGFLLIMMFY